MIAPPMPLAPSFMPHSRPQSSETPTTRAHSGGHSGGSVGTEDSGTNPVVKAPSTANLDRWAMFLSGVCVIHCLAIPATLVLTPLLAQDLINHQSAVHWVLLALAVPLSAVALWVGYGRHGFWPCLAIGGTGLLAMSIGVSHVAGEQAELPLSVVGALCLAYAHVENMRRHRPH